MNLAFRVSTYEAVRLRKRKIIGACRTGERGRLAPRRVRSPGEDRRADEYKRGLNHGSRFELGPDDGIPWIGNFFGDFVGTHGVRCLLDEKLLRYSGNSGL